MQRNRFDGSLKTAALMAAGVMLSPRAALAATDTALLPRNLSPWNMFVNADIVVQAVMVGLAFASLVTWTIWLAKTVEIRRKTVVAKQRLGLLEIDTVLSAVEQASRGGGDAVAQIIQSVAREASLSDGHFDDGFKERIALRLERVEAAMSRQIARGTGVLATIGATAPFVGLFGTVWGIYHALTAIGIAGQAAIDKVAGPVGEALIMTAFGLAVAVPAVLGYNLLVRRNKLVAERVRAFAADLHAVLLAGASGSGNGLRVVR